MNAMTAEMSNQVPSQNIRSKGSARKKERDDKKRPSDVYLNEAEKVEAKPQQVNLGNTQASPKRVKARDVAPKDTEVKIASPEKSGRDPAKRHGGEKRKREDSVEESKEKEVEEQPKKCPCTVGIMESVSSVYGTVLDTIKLAREQTSEMFSKLFSSVTAIMKKQE